MRKMLMNILRFFGLGGHGGAGMRALAHVKNKGDIITALDVGSTKVCCFIARIEEIGDTALAGIRILGIGHHAARGMRHGTVTDMEAAESGIRKAVHAAEVMARRQVDRVFVAVAGGDPLSRLFDAHIAPTGAAIDEGDLVRILGQGQSAAIGADRTMIHAIPTEFTVDGTGGVRDPRGMAGRRLAAQIHVVSTASGPLRNLSTVIERCHLDIEGYAVAPYAAGLASLSEDEMDLGVTLIDMGGETTSAAVFVGGALVYTDMLPLGGVHVTNDIARGLSTTLTAAERLKTLYGSAVLSPLDDQETLEAPRIGEETSVQQVQRSMLIRIIQPRLEEIFELVRDRLQESGFEGVAGRRIVLTGGASQMPGLDDLAQRILGKQVRMARPRRMVGLADAATGPAFSTCAGLLSYAVAPGFDVPVGGPVKNRAKDRARETISGRERPGMTGALGRAGLWLKENF